MSRTLLGTNLLIEQNARQAFNLDTILLAHFVKIPVKSKVVLDLGTGVGPLMLYLSTKTRAKIIGVEIQESRYVQALHNIKLNHLEHRLSCVHQDAREFYYKNVDVIVTNPPFFKLSEDANLSLDEEDRIARHEVMLTLEELCQVVSKNLKFGGYVNMIHRPDRLTEIIACFEKYQLSIKRIRFVHPYSDKPANHVLIEAMKHGQKGMKVEKPLIVYQEKHQLTEEMTQIYGGIK